MPEQTISPGVFTEERDQTFLRQGVQEIGGAFVGPTEKGPAFEPVEVGSPQEYERRFGNEGLYMDYSARNYLRDASTATVVRLLGEEGYESEAVEIQLPEGELSKRAFEISKAEFSLDADVDPGETIDFSLCFRGRQERSSVDETLEYDLTIDEYVDGEFHATVYEENGLDEDCHISSFTPDADEFAPVQYVVTAELSDGQTATVNSPTSQLQGFYLESVNYNWVEGSTKGENEIVSLRGSVANLTGNYSIEVYEVINGTLQSGPVASETGISDDRFEIAWVHGGSENDSLNYIVEATSGTTTDVPDDVSPSISVITRDSTSTFQLFDVNWNFDAGDNVDFGETLQVDAEASAPIDADLFVSGNQIPAQDVSGNPNDSSVYLEFDVGDSGINMSTGDTLDYELQVDEQGGPGTATNDSPEVILDGGVFQIDEFETDFDQGDEVGQNQLSGLEFTVINDSGSATPFDYDVIEVINGTDSGSVASGSAVSQSRVHLGLPNNGSAGDTVEYRLEVEQNATINSEDSETTPSQDVVSRSTSAFEIQDAQFNFDGSETVENNDWLFGSFDLDLTGVTTYDYELEIFVNGSGTGSTAVQDTGESAESVAFDWQVGDSGATLYDGDTFFYRLTVDDGSTTDTFDSPTLTYSGAVEPIFTFDSSEFQFNGGTNVEPGERLAVHFDVRRPSWPGNEYALRYEVREYIDGSSSFTVVADSLSEEGNEDILQGSGTPSDPQDVFEAGWFSGVTNDNNTVQYELVIEQVDTSNDTVLNSLNRMSGTLDVSERDPKTDITLAVLAPTERLRRDGGEIFNAQINPNQADVTGFELILDLDGSSVSTTSGGGGIGTQSHNPDDPVQDLLDSSGVTQSSTGPALIDGKSYEVGLQEGDSNYLLDLFGRTVESPREVFARARFPEVWEELIEDHLDEQGIDLKVEHDAAQLDFDGQGFDNAETPWIVSQDQQPNQPGADRQPLFRLETLSDGNSANTELKASIRNIQYPNEVAGSNYAQFDVVIREFDDSDRNPTVIESFSGVNLNPESQNYIGRVIGNRHTVFTEEGKLVDRGGEAGVFENRSDYVRVVVNEEVVRANQGGRDGLAHLAPWGFDSYSIPLDYKAQLPHGLKPRIVQSVTDVDYDILPEDGLNPDLSTAESPFDNRIHFGVDFDFEGNLSWLQAIAQNADSAADQSDYDQEYGFVLSDAYVEDPNSSGVRQIQYGDGSDEGFPTGRRKFNVAFQGGFDGMDPAKPEALEDEITSSNTQGLDVSGPDAPGTEAYERAIGILGNEDRFDINLLVTPGIINDLHSPVVQAGIDMVEDRADAFYVFDASGVDASVDDAVASIQSIDTSYAATYYPWMRIRDQTRNKQVRVPPSVLIPRVYAFNDQTSAEWYAPAGFERGGVPEAVSAVVRLRREDRDELYRNRVNPIAQFPGQGVSVWGQKTLQTQASALDRVNVRRLLIRVKKFIASTSRFLVFEQNVPETRNRFLNIVRPFLDQVQQQNGLFAFRVKMDADNNPPEVIDRNKLVGEIFLQPTRTAEFIELTFNVLPTGAEFEDL